MSPHTPTPWKVISEHPGQYTILPAKSAKFPDAWTIAYIRDFQKEDEANAAFIIRAVNNHTALVAALESLLGPLPDKWGYRAASNAMDDEKRTKARAALAAAQGEA